MQIPDALQDQIFELLSLSEFFVQVRRVCSAWHSRSWTGSHLWNELVGSTIVERITARARLPDLAHSLVTTPLDLPNKRAHLMLDFGKYSHDLGSGRVATAFSLGALTIMRSELGHDAPALVPFLIGAGRCSGACCFDDALSHQEKQVLREHALRLAEMAVFDNLEDYFQQLHDVLRCCVAGNIWQAAPLSDIELATALNEASRLELISFALLNAKKTTPEDLASDLNQQAYIFLYCAKPPLPTMAHQLYCRSLRLMETSCALQGFAGTAPDLPLESRVVLCERAMALRRGGYGEDHWNVAVGLQFFSRLLAGYREFAQACHVQSCAVAIYETAFGVHSPCTDRARMTLKRWQALSVQL